MFQSAILHISATRSCVPASSQETFGIETNKTEIRTPIIAKVIIRFLLYIVGPLAKAYRQPPSNDRIQTITFIVSQNYESFNILNRAKVDEL